MEPSYWTYGPTHADKITDPEDIPTYRVLVCGNRRWNDPNLVYAFLFGLESMIGDHIFGVISGAATGADTHAILWAQMMQIAYLPLAAEWHEHDPEGYSGIPCKGHSINEPRCPAAGPRRNAKMLKYGMPHQVVAFTDNLRKSRGTLDMVTRAQALAVPTVIIGREIY